MKEFFARLNPTERRFVVGVAVVFFLVINIVWVWPHFADWGTTRGRMDAATTQLSLFESGTNLIPGLQGKIAKFQGQGQVVPPADQAVQFVRLIQNQMTQFGIIPQQTSVNRQSGPTNSFFVDQGETLTMDTTEKQLVDFLYSLGASSNSLVRVKVLSVQPDPSHQRLTTRVTLVASYQKKAIGGVGAAAPRRAAPEQKPAPAAAPPNGQPAPTRPGATNRAATNRPFTPLAAPNNSTPTKK